MNLTSKSILLFLTVTIFIFLTACGQSYPTIAPEQMKNKLSALVLLDDALPEAQQAAIGSSLTQFNQSQITYEWMKNVTGLQSTVKDSVYSKPYDYVIVAGTALSQTMLKEAAGIKNKRWIFLQSGAEAAPTAALPVNAMVRVINPAAVVQKKTQWVTQQRVLGHRIEWITASTKPIPAEWMLPEESGNKRFIDTDPLWFEQLTTATRLYATSFIALNVPVDQVSLQKIQTLRIPIKDMTATLPSEVQWSAAIRELIPIMKNNEFKTGVAYYGPQEILVK